MCLSSGQRQYLLVGQCVIPIAINFVLNGFIGLLMFHGVNPVPTWGIQSSAGPDLIGTCFFLPAITCLIVTPIIRRHMKSGKVEHISQRDFLPSWLRPFQRPLLVRSLFFGLAGLASIGAVVAMTLFAVASGPFELDSFLWFKACFSAALGGVVTPFIGLVALAEGGGRAQAI